MSNLEIKNKIDRNNKIIEKMFAPNTFTLNNIVSELLEENSRLQSQCSHKYDMGYCIYCYKEAPECK